MKREESPRATTVHDRDLDVLAAILEHRFLTTELLLLLFPPDPAKTPTKAIAAALQKRGATFTGKHIGSNLEKRLRECFHAGLVDRIPRGLGHPFAYALGREGQKLLRKHDRVARRIELAKPSDRLFYVEHTLMIARFRIALRVAVSERPSLEIRTSKREGRDLRHAWRRGADQYSVNPDAYVVLADRDAPEGRNSRALFIECDRGTMSRERLLDKYETYARFELSGELERRFGVAHARVVTVVDVPSSATETLTRASALLNLVADSQSDLLADMRDRFLFTTEEAYRAQPMNLLAAIWRCAEKPAERNALIPSPLPLRS
jgi:hypothetical protein